MTKMRRNAPSFLLNLITTIICIAGCGSPELIGWSPTGTSVQGERHDDPSAVASDNDATTRLGIHNSPGIIATKPPITSNNGGCDVAKPRLLGVGLTGWLMRWENETVFHTTQFNGTITPSANGKECSANIEGELGTWQIKILATELDYSVDPNEPNGGRYLVVLRDDPTYGLVINPDVRAIWAKHSP